jgi:sec-independent protein translocase protein TatA
VAPTNFALLDLGTPELLIILAIILLLFGGKKLPELSRSLGVSMKNLREGFNEANGAKEDLKKQASGLRKDLSFNAAPGVSSVGEQKES